MNHTPFPLSELRDLDSSPSRELTDDEKARRDETFSHIVSEAHPAPRRRRARRPLMLGLTAAAALALVGAIVVAALPALTQAPVSSYALPAHGSLGSWTPQTSTASVTSADVQSCVSALGLSASNQSPVVLTSEKRGDFTSFVVEQGSHDGYCVMAGGEVETWLNFDGLVAHPLDDPNSAVISVMQGGSWMFVVSGHAGPNVTSLTVKNPETGENVTASLAHGVWSAWWPVAPDSVVWKSDSQNETFTDAITISYATADGQTHESGGITPGDEASSEEVPPGQPVLATLSGWSAQSVPVVPSATDVDRCGAAVDGWPNGSATIILAETRGSFETLALERNGVDVTCALKSGVVQWSTDTGIVQTDPVADDAAAYTGGNGFDGIDDATRITQMRGTAGSDVTSVTVHLAGGNDVQAALQNGVWMAWWPESEPAALGGPTPEPTNAASAAPVPAGPPAFSWTTSDGVTHDSQ